MPLIRLPAILTALRALTAAGLLALAVPAAAQPAPPTPAAPTGAPTGAAIRPDIGGPFDLTSSRGGRFTDADLRGRPHAILFGYTFCPDVCPTALAELTLTLQDLGPAGEDLRVLFITIDPERDSPDHLAGFLAMFDPRFIGLSGTAEETATVARAFKAIYLKAPLPDGGYTMDHTALVYLMDRQGRFLESLDYRDDHARHVEAFKRLLAAR